MSGASVKRQVLGRTMLPSASDRDPLNDGETTISGYDYWGVMQARDALAPCVVLTAEEAETLCDDLTHTAREWHLMHTRNGEQDAEDCPVCLLGGMEIVDDDD